MPAPRPVRQVVKLPALKPGQQVIRLSPSSTGRAIYPGMRGVIGGLKPQLHDNPSFWQEYEYIPIQWQNGLWSNLEGQDRGMTWQYFPKPTPQVEALLDRS